MDVKTETNQDWAKDVDTETPSRLSLISDSIKPTKENQSNHYSQTKSTDRLSKVQFQLKLSLDQLVFVTDDSSNLMGYGEAEGVS